jgi:Na+/melibiose symporter-like transporter
MFKEIRATLGTHAFVALIATGFFIALGSGIGSSLSMYWTLYVYQFTQAQMSLLIAPVLLGSLATGIAPLIAARMGKRNAAILLSWIYVVTASAPLIARVLELLPAKSPALFGMVMVQTAVAPATMTMVLIMLGSMISDLVEDAEVRTGRRSEGLLLAANSFVRKATQGLGTMGAGIILTLVSFPKAERKNVPEAVLTHMVLLYVAITVVLFIATTIALLLYRQDRAAHESNLRKLAEKSALEAATVTLDDDTASPPAETAHGAPLAQPARYAP